MIPSIVHKHMPLSYPFSSLDSFSTVAKQSFKR